MGTSSSKNKVIKIEEKDNPKQGKRIDQVDTKHATAIPESSSEKLYNSIVKINVYLNEKDIRIGTGFFISPIINKKIRYFLMTCHHVIKEEFVKKKKFITLYYGKSKEEKKFEIKLDRDKRYIKCFKKPLDVTLIEIIKEDEIREDKFLYPDLNYKNKMGYDFYVDKDFYLAGYPQNNERSVSSGKITKILKEKVEFEHSLDAKGGNSGSPICLSNNLLVVGIHKEGDETEPINYGTFFGYILDDLEREKEEKKEEKNDFNEIKQEKKGYKKSKSPTLKKKKKGGKRKVVEKKIEDKIPEVKKRVRPKRTNGKDWWKLCRNFVNLYLFWGTASKYSMFYRKIRENEIEERTIAIAEEITILKDWIIAMEAPFWNEFKIFDDINVSFKSSDEKNKIKKQSQKIMALIKIFMENLISRSSKLSDIPTKVQKIIYEFIKNRAYFPKYYISTYQVNRIDFEFYGGSRLITVPQGAMIISFLLISGIFVQQILLHIKDVFIEYRNYHSIKISAKYIGSIIHYLTKNTFMYDPGLKRDILALFNYYRNYHLYNEQIEEQNSINDKFIGQSMLQDTENEDEFAEYLIDENDINEFWNLNPKFVETYKNLIYSWSCKLAKAIKLKYEQEFPNPLPRKKLKRPLLIKTK